MDTLSGNPRFNFGSMYLLGGIPFTSFIIGAIGFAQIIELMTSRNDKVDADFNQKLTIKGSLLTKDDFKRLIFPSIRSGIIGTFVGVLPGAGATTGAFIGYSMQKNFKNKYELGTGTLEGIAASEAANNSAAAGAFAPLLALGIPGSGTGAVLLGGLMMRGLNPGPLLFEKDPEFAWGMIASLYVANVLTGIIGVCLIPFLLKILSVPTKVLIPIIAVVCIVGSYSATYSMYGVIIMLISGVVAYLFNKNGFSAAPMLLSFVLAPLLESNMRKAFVISGGSLRAFFLSPMATGLMVVFFLFIITPIVRGILGKSKK